MRASIAALKAAASSRSSGFQLAKFAQYDKLTASRNIPSYRLARGESSRSLEVATRGARSKILENGVLFPRGDIAQKASVASPLGETMSFRDNTGDLDIWSPPLDERLEQRLDGCARRALDHANRF